MQMMMNLMNPIVNIIIRHLFLWIIHRGLSTAWKQVEKRNVSSTVKTLLNLNFSVELLGYNKPFHIIFILDRFRTHVIFQQHQKLVIKLYVYNSYAITACIYSVHIQNLLLSSPSVHFQSMGREDCEKTSVSGNFRGITDSLVEWCCHAHFSLKGHAFTKSSYDAFYDQLLLLLSIAWYLLTFL